MDVMECGSEAPCGWSVRTSGKNRWVGTNQGTELVQLLQAPERGPWLEYGCGIISVP